MTQIVELLSILGLYLLGATLIAAGAFLIFGLGVCLVVTGCFSLAGAMLLARGIARVPTD